MISRRTLLRASPVLLLPLAGNRLAQSWGGQAVNPLAGTQPPRGTHLSWTEDPHSTRTVTWFTSLADDAPGMVEFGHEGLTQTAVAQTQRTYGVPVTTHRAILRDFDPTRPLRYRVRSGPAISGEYFVPPSPTERFRFAHFGDHGRSAYSRAVRDGIRQRACDFFLVAGDLAYANGEQPVWDDWFDQLEPLAAEMPMMCCPGNHENKDGNGAAYRTRLSHPGSRGTFYSFDYGRVHFMVSTGGALLADGTLPLELLKIETDLAAAALRRAAGQIDFIVFVQHYSIWTDEEGRSPGNPLLVLVVENILLRYGVDLLLVGHDHAYQRSYPMGLGRPLDKGYVQVIAGGGGQSMRGFDGRSVWSAVQHRRYGFVEYSVEPGAIHATAWAVDESEDGAPTSRLTAIDSFTLRSQDAERRAAAVRPVREFSALVADAGMEWPAVEMHTRLRNAAPCTGCLA